MGWLGVGVALCLPMVMLAVLATLAMLVMFAPLGRPSITLVMRAMTTGVCPLTLVMRAMLLMPAGMTSFTLVIGVVLPLWVRVPQMPTPCIVPIFVGAAGFLGR